MAWFKIEIHHGPGHQSRTVKYEYTRRATKETIAEFVEEEKEGDYDWPIITVKKIRALPEGEKGLLIQKYTYQRDNAVAMLEILKKTKTTREYEWQCVKCERRRPCKSNGLCYKPCEGRLKRVVKRPFRNRITG